MGKIYENVLKKIITKGNLDVAELSENWPL